MRGSTEEPRESSRAGVHAEYDRRLAARREAHRRLAVRERWVTESRLIVFVVGLVLSWVAWGTGRAAPGWVAVPAGLFVVLLLVHARIERAGSRAGRAVEFYEKGLARLEDRWAGKGERGLRFLETDHPYAADLDLFGAGSLFERLCTARTRAGEDALAGWLLHPADPETVRERQAAVAELRDRIDLREELELLGADVRAGIDPEGLAAWGSSPRVFGPQVAALPAAALALSVLTVLALAAWWFGDVSLTPFLLMLACELVFMRRFADRIHRVVAPLDRRTHELLLLGQLLARLEREPLAAPLLAGFRARLVRDGRTASEQIHELARLLQWLDAQKNQLVMPLAAVALWSFQMALRIDAWRARWGPSIAAWLAAAGKFEALCALAAYAFENPADPFPEVVPEGACFEAVQVGHPLIAERDCVRNDVALGTAVRVLVVSGSNMSGKSTLLRTVGINTVLALAGAPVRARSLRVSPLEIGATLRIQDSLQAGRSRFFAEITRLRQLVDLSRGRWPLLFLLDEILHGTNSHDRRVGGEAVVRGLLARGAIGLVTTHDLALAEIVERLGPEAANVHFEDHFENGTLHFDYTMRPGVVRKSNALALMRAVGLDV